MMLLILSRPLRLKVSRKKVRDGVYLNKEDVNLNDYHDIIKRDILECCVKLVSESGELLAIANYHSKNCNNTGGFSYERVFLKN